MPEVTFVPTDDDATAAARLLDERDPGSSEPVEEIIATLLTHVAAGQAVSVTARDREVSTQVAADLLGVSRAYLVQLLDRGEIPYRRKSRRANSHRLVKVADVLEYRRRDDAERDEAFRELVAQSEELGLYDE